MMIVPWTMGTAIFTNEAGTFIGSIGPVPAGLRVLGVTFQPAVSTSKNINVAVTVGEARARVEADMVGQRSIFPRSEIKLGSGLNVMFERVFSGMSAFRFWSWDLDIKTGPVWFNVLVQFAGGMQATFPFGVVGYRVVKRDEDP